MMHNEMSSVPPLGWARVCQLCWEQLEPEQYFPDAMEYDTCHVCLEPALTAAMRTRELVASIERGGEEFLPTLPQPREPGTFNLQDLINRHQWSLEGAIGRSMMAAVEAGRAVMGLTPTRDYWGNRLPSRFELKPGTKGTVGFWQAAQAKEVLA